MFIIAKNVSAWWLEHQSARGYISTDKMTIDIPRKLKTSLLPSFVSIGSWFPSWWRAKRDLENRSSRKLWHERPTVNRSETWRWKKTISIEKRAENFGKGGAVFRERPGVRLKRQKWELRWIPFEWPPPNETWINQNRSIFSSCRLNRNV